jgi:hypothetical protein
MIGVFRMLCSLADITIVLAEPGDGFDHVYFPHSGMLSLPAVMKDGKAIETATVGREELVGGTAGLGLYKSSPHSPGNQYP